MHPPGIVEPQKVLGEEALQMSIRAWCESPPLGFCGYLRCTDTCQDCLPAIRLGELPVFCRAEIKEVPLIAGGRAIRQDLHPREDRDGSSSLLRLPGGRMIGPRYQSSLDRRTTGQCIREADEESLQIPAGGKVANAMPPHVFVYVDLGKDGTIDLAGNLGEPGES